MIYQVIKEENSRPIKIWTDDIESTALEQAKNIARLPFIASNGVALMPDVHAGKGSTIGSVIATDRVVIPAAVGSDLGCGMIALRLSLKSNQLPDSLLQIRNEIEKIIPMGAGGAHQENSYHQLYSVIPDCVVDGVFNGDYVKAKKKAVSQLGTLGSGNHFIELCIDENQDVWIMLHSGSRGIGNMIGSYYINKAKELMTKFYINLPDVDLAYLPEGSEEFDDYIAAMTWAQDYAYDNRQSMMNSVLSVLHKQIDTPFNVTQEAINVHHNYCTKENHFGKNMWITRKGAIRAMNGDLGIIPGSMGQKSYIVRGKGNHESYCSCSHGAGRKMSRTAARNTFNLHDLEEQTAGVECRKDSAVLDEIPASYKDIDSVMNNQTDLVEVVHTLKQVMCVKGG